MLLAEDGTRVFQDRPAPTDAIGRLVVPGPAGLLPFSATMAPGEWRALRRPAQGRAGRRQRRPRLRTLGSATVGGRGGRPGRRRRDPRRGLRRPAAAAPPSAAATSPAPSATATPSPTASRSSRRRRALVTGTVGSLPARSNGSGVTRTWVSVRTYAAAEGHHAPAPLVLRGVAGVRTLMMVRSARNRSWEYSKTTPSASLVVRVMDSSGSARVGAEDRGLVLARGDDLDVLLRLAGDGLVVLLQQVVERAAERAGRAAGGTARRAAGRARGRSASRRPAGCGPRRPRRRPRPSSSAVAVSSSASAIAVLMIREPDVIPCARSSAGHAHDARQVALDLLRAHEGAAAPPRDPAYGARALERAEGLAHRRAAHAQLLARGRARRPAARRGAAARAGSGPAAGGVRARRPGRSRARDSLTVTGAQIPSSAAGDSGSTWPPSTTRVWPVM